MEVEWLAPQKTAMANVTAYARARKARAGSILEEICRMCNVPSTILSEALSAVREHARVALHFHPDRPDPDFKSVAEALAESGVYKSQFETKLSSGGLTAYLGGERDRWEEKLFGGAYHGPDSTERMRPKYGALNLMRHSDGPSPRFGSCYFLLKPEVSRRSTFTYLDSHQDPTEKGTWDEPDDLFAALLEDIFYFDFALGERDLTVPGFLKHLIENLSLPLDSFLDRPSARNLNHYIEAQVHGDIRLGRDVETLVADPSFRDTPTVFHLNELSRRYGIELKWHKGFSLKTLDVPVDFRGPTMPSLARRIAAHDRIDAGRIGPAVFDLKRHPEAWRDRETPSEVLQELKLLWHVLVKLGEPFDPLKSLDQ